MKGKFLLILMTSFSLVVLTACSHNEEEEVNSPMVFYGESENWGATLVVKQVQNKGDHMFKITEVSDLTYKGNAGEKDNKQTRGTSTSVQVSIEGVSPESGSSIRLQEYNTWRQNSNTSKEYAVKDDEFEVVVTWNNKEETFTLSHNYEKTPEVNRYNAAEVYKVLSKPQSNRVHSF
ncbi:hypothetical protein CEH05_16295 [Halobacillus halophilus]|uniref:Lipoprotein n=1 Tax=Halobacillus halophilus (strain ATCC 35676 / DSM 2266 / JCM 20832 / KCTC 3685 / LMG 17431 / NBRC 102448 / NCIMB 2269) TaxID=866895 RepID=I0JR65_HALH3|nr:hypothetical protein [Halobacillus halophilus]ASF40630.1 hypothetical protein CEH05_16295 [Halobacillus halophilus]CCG46635.1 hypothetical protein HBHAL_4294 [Halobacillus halophilus DSM 2266]